MSSPLRALAEIILNNVGVLEDDCVKRKTKMPSMQDVFKEGSDFTPDDLEVQTALHTISAAAHQIIHTIRNPQLNLVVYSFGCAIAAAIRVAAEFHIADILKEAGPEGLHYKDIAAKCRADPAKLAPTLRLLASAWVFREVEPDVFANNRNSSVMAKGLPTEELFNSPEKIYSEPESVLSAFISMLGDEFAKGQGHLYEAFSDPKTAFSAESTDAAVPRALGQPGKTLWDIYELPGETSAKRLHRFGKAMIAQNTFEPIEPIFRGFDWDALKDDSIIVDVGGGIGGVALPLSKKHPNLKFVVQDREAVVEEGIKHANTFYPEGLKSEKIQYQAHDFFAPQPIKNATAFMMRFILHDWHDEYSRKILQSLRDAATPDTHLIIMDKVIPHGCPSSEVSHSIPGALKTDLPRPISNMTGGAIYPNLSSMAMTIFFNGKERTLGEFEELCLSAGWQVVDVHQQDAFGQAASLIHALPL